jgi:hypothetical protein
MRVRGSQVLATTTASQRSFLFEMTLVAFNFGAFGVCFLLLGMGNCSFLSSYVYLPSPIPVGLPK